MSDDLATAPARAREIVAESVWGKLSENAQASAINEEILRLYADNAASVTIPSPGH